MIASYIILGSHEDYNDSNILYINTWKLEEGMCKLHGSL